MNDNEILVKVEGLSKKFCKDLKTSFSQQKMVVRDLIKYKESKIYE